MEYDTVYTRRMKNHAEGKDVSAALKNDVENELQRGQFDQITSRGQFIKKEARKKSSLYS